MSVGQRLELLEKHPLFQKARKIVQHLNDQGHLTVLAGGCVRDGLLGVSPKDLDIATSAPPDLVEKSFERTLAVGKAFGTIVVVDDGENFEVTTFRSDGPYLDGRHPAHVEFASASEDAKRRDFTVNALFYDPLKHEIVDFVGGIADLENKILKAVGRPIERFKEDRLRMLRAARFVAQLGFELDPETFEAIKAEADQIEVVSVERIYNEMKRLLESRYFDQGLKVLIDSGLARKVFPEVSDLKIGELAKFPTFTNWENAFAALCLIQGVSDPEPRLRAWKVSRDSLKRVQAQLSAVKLIGNEATSRAARVRALGGDVYAETLNLLSAFFPADAVEEWISEYLAVANKDGHLPKAFLNGEDLRAVGVPPGEQMGKVLKEAFDAQLEGRITSREAALSYLKTKA